jgi:uncharacterized membrane protein YjfL (UPF0719 family)
MDLGTVLLALLEFVITAATSVLVVYVNYRLFIVTNPDYNAEEELKKDNMGVAFLLAAQLIAAGMIVREGIYPTVNMLRLYYTAPTPYLNGWEVIALVFAHLGAVFFVAVTTISLALRFWGKLTTNIREGAELARGNTAVGIVLAGVVLVVSMFMSDAVSRLTKSLIPQPTIGHVEIGE